MFLNVVFKTPEVMKKGYLLDNSKGRFDLTLASIALHQKPPLATDANNTYTTAAALSYKSDSKGADDNMFP